jgi:hypothetical protein
MIQAIYNAKDLNLDDLTDIGLYKDNKLLLEADDLQALLAGRRTNMLELKDLYFADFHISALNAKVSLNRNRHTGKLDVLIHPLYREILAPEFLTKEEAEKLEKGEIANVSKRVRDRELLVEFDKDTNEYIVTDSDQILAPDKVNGQELTPDQKERYRRGKQVELEDGTCIEYAAREREGIRSNKVALIASIVLDGGISYLLYQGLNALFGKKHDAASEQFSEGYRQAFTDMKAAENDPMEALKLAYPDKEYSGGYGRSGTSR